MKKIKEFFNKPAPLIIVLIIIIALQTFYIANYNSKNRIYIGKISTQDVTVDNIHYFTNGDMNFFYASPAIYNKKDVKVYNYLVGYYVEDNNDLVEFVSRSSNLDKATSLSDIIDEMSSWSIAEADSIKNKFNDNVRNKLNKLHFIIQASTKKDSNEPDININVEVNPTKITK